MTRDARAARDYYEKTCGWRYDCMRMDDGTDYFVAMVGDSPIAGIMEMTGNDEMKDLPPHWFTYLSVDDVDLAVLQTEDMGGTIIRPPFDVSGIGRIAIIQDPTGAALGIMTPAESG